MSVEISGFCDERCRPLEEAFAANFADGLELGASLALMHHGRPLLDIWAGHANAKRTRPWEKDTIVLLASTTKITAILSLLLLIDRGLVELDAPVAAYWPDFAAAGKAHVTVREAMSHRGGVPGFAPPLSFVSQGDWTATVANLAAQDHWFGGESTLCYHAHTYGFLLGEIVRRVDGRRPAQFFREEIAEPAGIDMQIGLRDEAERQRTAQAWSLVPAAPLRSGNPVAERAYQSVVDGPLPNSWEYQSCEQPSGNAYGNGRSIARMCAIPACGGVLDGVRYLSPALVDEATRQQVFAEDPFFGPLSMGLGFGLDSEGFPAPTPTSFHWGGAGGSLACGDQTSGVSFGYAMNNFIMTIKDFEELRFQRLWAALGEVIAAL